MHSLTSLALRNLTAHPLRSLLTALAITLGVGMLLAAAIVGQAAGHSAAQLTAAGPPADLEIFSRDGAPFDRAVLDALRAAPDVDRLSPSLRLEAQSLAPSIPRLTILGVEPAAYQALHEIELADGAFLDAPDAIVLPLTVALSHGLRVGDPLTLTVDGRSAALVVAGRLQVRQDAILSYDDTALISLSAAQTLAGAPEQIDRIEIALRPGADLDRAKTDLARRAGFHLVVVRAQVAGGVAFNTVLIQAGLALVGLIILFAAGFVILNAFAMSITGRTRELGALRALGMTRRQVTRTVLTEAGLLGLSGAGVGLLAGLALAWGVMRAMGLLDDAPFLAPWWGLTFSPLVGLAATLLGALQPARRASRVSPIVAARPESTAAPGWYVRSGGRLGLGLLLLLLPALAAFGLIGQPDIWQALAAVGVGIAGLLAAMVLLLPAMIAPVAALCRPLLERRWGVAGRLAADNLSRNRLRSALTAGALVAGLTMIVATSGLLTLFLENSIGLIGAVAHEDILISRDFIGMMASGQMTLDNIYQTMTDFTLDPALAGVLAPLADAGVIQVERVGIAPVPPELTTVPTGIASGMFVDAEVFLPIGNFDFYTGDAKTALALMQRGRAVLLQPLAAERLGVGVGDSLTLETPRGQVEFTVAGIGGSGLFSPIFPYADGEAYFDLAGLFQLNAVVAKGHDVDAVLAQIQEIIRPYPDVVATKDVGGIVDQAAKMFGRFQAILDALLLLAVVVAGLGVVNTMVINVAERRRELGLLRAVGATQRQVRRAVVVEAATLGLMAALTAAGLGLLMLLIYLLVVTPNGWGALGVRPDGATTWRNILAALGNVSLAAAAALVFGPLVAGLAAYLPARQAAANDIVEATRSDRIALRSAPAAPRQRPLPHTPRAIHATLNSLAWRNLTAHPLRSLLTALAIALGVGMVLAAAIVGQAASRSAGEISAREPQIALEIQSRDGAPFDQAVLDTLRAAPDVDRLSPSLRLEAQSLAPSIPRLTILGVEPAAYQALHEIELADGAFLDAPDAIVLPLTFALSHGLRVGDPLTLTVDGRSAALVVAGRLRVEQDAILSHDDAALIPLNVAQTLAGTPAQIHRLQVSLRPGADIERSRADLAAQLAPSLIVARAAASERAGVAVFLVQLGLAMAGAIMLFAAAFVILNAFAMSITGRTQEIGALRALGMTRRQVMGQVWAEAGLLGLGGAVVGVAAGLGLAWSVMRLMGQADDVPFAVPWWGAALSLSLGLGVTLVAALQPAWRASRISPLAAVRPQSVTSGGGWCVRHGGRLGGGLLLVLLLGLAAVALLLRPNFLWAFALAGLGQIGLLLATVLLLPALVGPVVWLCRPLLIRQWGVAGRLAADNLSRNKLRAVLTAGAMIAAFTTIISTSALTTATLKGGLRGYFSFFNEDGMVMPDIATLLASGELSIENSYERLTVQAVLDPALVEAVQTAARADGVTVERIAFAPIPAELSPIPGAPGLFVEPEIFLDLGNFDFFDGDAASALALMQRGRAVLLFPITAERLGVSVGDALPVQTPRGRVEFTVAGIGGNGYNFTAFAYADGETYFDVTGPSWLGLIVPEGKNADQTIRRINQAIEPFAGTVAARLDAHALENSFFKVVNRLQTMLNALLLLAVVVAGLGVVNTMVINVAERRREIALLRAVGATQRQVRQAVIAEAVALGLMAALAAAALSLAMLALFALAMTPGGVESMGFRLDWHLAALAVPPALRDLGLAAALSLLFGPLVAGLAAYLPARQAAAMNVIEATRSERVTLPAARSPLRKRRPPPAARATLSTLAWRNLSQSRSRTVLSGLAVALGVAMTVAADVTSNAILNAISGSEDARTILTGLLDQLDRMLLLVSVMIALAAGFLVFNAFAMAVTQRRQQIGALRALGAARRQVMRLVLLEALLIGGGGVLLGLLAGPLLGRATITLIKTIVGESVFAFAGNSASPAGLLLAAALGLSVTLLSVLLPARRAARIAPLAALRQEAVGQVANLSHLSRPLRALAGALAVVALGVYLAVAPPGEWVQPPWDARLTILLALLWLSALALLLPALIGGLGRGLRRPLARLWGATGRLAADNFRRSRGRVTVTVITLAVALTTIVGVTGFMSFIWDALMRPKIEGAGRLDAWIVTTGDFISGMAAYAQVDDIMLPPQVAEEVRRAVAGRARTMEWRFAVAPELSFWGDSYFSFVIDPQAAQQTGDLFFTFNEGNWQSARSLMETGCGVLVAPSVAGKNGVSLGDTFTVTGARGPVACTVAGVGAPYVGASILGPAAAEAFDVTDPIGLLVWPLPGVDRAALEADLAALLNGRPDAGYRPLNDLAEMQTQVIDALPTLFNALLLLAIVAAALGVVNTTAMSVAERRRELGLLRAVGATRRQVAAVVSSEAALIGLVGGGLGLIAGAGVTVILAVTYGGNGWGLPDLDLWPIAWQTVQPALRNGLVGLIAAPFICAAAAWLPARAILRGSAVETLNPERRPPPARPGAKSGAAMRSLSFLARRNLAQARTRTVLSVLAVALGAATIVAANVIANAARSATQAVDERNLGALLGEVMNVSLNIVGVVVLAAAGFLVFNAFAMAVTQRRQQIGALRALGATRRQVMWLVLLEALLTGGSGVLLGLLAGPLLGRGLIALLRLASELLGVTLAALGEPAVSLWSLATAAAMGMGVTLFATLVPARQATRISPLAALRQETAAQAASLSHSSHPRRALAGGLVALALTVYLAIAPPGEWVQPPWDGILSSLLALAWLLCMGLALPALVAAVSRLARRSLGRLRRATGRLAADNLSRNRGRVTLTVLTLAVSLTTIVSVTGIMTFTFDILLRHITRDTLQRGGWIVLPLDFTDALEAAASFDLDTTYIPPEMVAEVYHVASGRADVGELHMTNVPELAFLPGLISYVFDPQPLQRLGLFTFTEGDWQTAAPIMDSGCGVLITPLVARRNDVRLGDTLSVQGANGPVECTVAGIGRNSLGNISIISRAAGEAFGIANVPGLFVSPLPGVDEARLEADLAALAARYPGTSLNDLSAAEGVVDIFDRAQTVMNALLLLAIVTAALGVVNTTAMSIAERRRELGLLRAVGASRRQVTAVVTGEAALIGLVGGGLGLVAGAGIVAIFAVTYGGNAWGVKDLPLWPSAWQSVQPALLNGLVGLIAAPFVCAAAAWLPARAILRGSAVETLRPSFTSLRQRKTTGLLRRGNIRTRFVLGSGALMILILAGLVGVATAHEQRYLEDVTQDALAALVEGQAGLIALNLPPDAATLTLADLMQLGRFDAQDLLRFRALVDEANAYGLETFAITDGDGVALLSLDPRQTGAILPALESPGETWIASEQEAGEWQLRAAAPIRNEAGQVIGSVRLTANLAGIRDFVGQTRGALWAVGGLVVALGLALSWALTTPLAAVTGQLAAHAAHVARGEYVPLPRPQRRLSALVTRTSLRTRLTIALALGVVVLVGALEMAVIPVERHHTETELKDSIIAAADWLGQATSAGLASEPSSDSPAGSDDEEIPTFEQVLSRAGALDWAQLQELSEQTRNQNVAYVALVDRDGVVQLSDQLALIGETVPVPSQTHVQDGRWRDEAIWIVSAPLWNRQDGELIGALRLGVRRAGIEAFLDESRTLFRLAGLIGVLAGALLAQAVGGAVTAPVRELAAGVRRVGQGDLDAQFEVDARDELSLLAAAFNQMVAGLREREWLRDMFGRFVSREVAEAIRAGQVRLEGENRVVSVLFCDIRDFTARSERNTPEQVVALLNEYLPLVVEAAQAHAGTVNKFGGDSTLIVYGAPRRLQESAYQAVLTALQMRAGLAQLNAQLAGRGEAPIRIGVGINTGAALAGAVGPKERQEYTVIGDTVNLASRIEALNKEFPAYDILISDQTYEALGSRRAEFAFADLGELPVRGKAGPVRVWAVLDRLPNAAPPAA